MHDRDLHALVSEPGGLTAAATGAAVDGERSSALDVQSQHVALRTLLDSFDGPAWSVDRQYRLLAANVAFFNQTALYLGRQINLGEDLLSLGFAKYSVESWQQHYDRALLGESFAVRHRAQLTDQGHTFEYRLKPLRSSSGTVEGVSVFARDVTAKVRTEVALLLNSHILDNLGEGVSLVRDRDGAIVYANPAFSRMFGYKPDELHGQPVAILNAPTGGHPEQLAAEIFKQLREVGVWRGEIQNRRKDGSVFHCRASVTGSQHPEHGEVWISMHQDITDRVRAEAALRESEQRFRSILDHAPMLISAKDLSGRVTLTNRHFDVLAGPGASDFVGRSIFDLFPQDVAGELWRNDQAALQARTTVESEERVQHRDGSWHTYHTRKFPLTDSEGQVFAVAAISADITERLQAEAERAAMQAQLMETQRLESLGVLAGGIAHDINNYLVPILGSASMLTADLGTTPTTQTLLAQITTSARHIRDLVQQMLAFAGKGRFVSRGIHLDDLLGELMPLLQSSIAKNASLKLHCENDLPSIDGDPAQLRQVVMNLILNAAEALDRKPGLIQVTLRRKPDGQEPSERSAAGVVLEVADNGPGIPPGVLPRIFDPFFTTKNKGRGLGLSAVQGIVRSHHGTISVSCPPDGGTVFTLCFPTGQLSVEPTPPPARSTVPPTARRRILVVDDEPSVRETVALMLKRLGYDTRTTDQCEEALHLLTTPEHEIAGVLLDLTLPCCSGEDLVRKIRRVAPTLPVLIMSGYNANDSLGPDIVHGLAGLLTKPFTPAELQALLQKIWREDRAN